MSNAEKPLREQILEDESSIADLIETGCRACLESVLRARLERHFALIRQEQEARQVATNRPRCNAIRTIFDTLNLEYPTAGAFEALAIYRKAQP